MERRIASIYRRFYEAANYRLRTAAGGRFCATCLPVSISLLVTERCNARCVHCDIWKNKGKEDSPTPEQWKALLTELRRWLGPVQVTLTGGEALLQPFTPDLLAHGVSLGLFMELLTHGYWTDRSRLEKAAIADPWRITMSLDGIGETHSIVRGRANFWDVCEGSLQMLARIRSERNLSYIIRLKTVLMDHNVRSAAEVAHFARDNGMEVFYQPIEQNYNTDEDERWFETAPTWPKDSAGAIATVQELIRLKREGYPVANSFPQLEVMIPYFRDPAGIRVAVQDHAAHEGRRNCSALVNLQVQSNGDVRSCSAAPPIGNLRDGPIRRIWRDRPRRGAGGCCREQRCRGEEKPVTGLAVLQ
jgi:MoaA/NifB/PqqE/SkfB family radical SAM enzyme